jgi:hypothetical protein
MPQDSRLVTYTYKLFDGDFVEKELLSSLQPKCMGDVIRHLARLEMSYLQASKQALASASPAETPSPQPRQGSRQTPRNDVGDAL